MNILFIGDVVGRIGREIVSAMIERITSENEVDFIIANGENATHGKGLSEAHFNELLDAGIDVVTLGNHYAAKKEIFSYIDTYDNILRPNNLHSSIPGVGTNVFECNGVRIRVTNLLGRVEMNMDASNPFDDLQNIVNEGGCDIHIVDFHAEATGEKYALANAFDGEVSAVLGTHTHVQTRDYRLLKKGTAYMSDVGMCGPYDSILGVKKEDIVTKTWTGIPTVFNVMDEGPGVFSAVLLTFDDKTYKCVGIRPIYKVLEENEY
jgi:metallophosphoesterase (TIGR00282 family)